MNEVVRPASPVVEVTFRVQGSGTHMPFSRVNECNGDVTPTVQPPSKIDSSDGLSIDVGCGCIIPFGPIWPQFAHSGFVDGIP